MKKSLPSNAVWSLTLALAASGCGKDERPPNVHEFSVVAEHERAAFTAVHGSSEKDVWIVGADEGGGPIALHFDGANWEQKATGVHGDLWWVQSLSPDLAFMAGSDSHLLRYTSDGFERLSTPGLGKHIIFGLWAAAADDLYAVGAIAGRNGFLWHYDGEKLVELELPDEIIDDAHDHPPLFKVAGRSADDVWIVGGKGTILRGNHRDGFSAVESSTDERLFTVAVDEDEVLIVGGSEDGVLLSGDPRDENLELQDMTPAGAPLLQGAYPSNPGRRGVAAGSAWAVGRDGAVFINRGTGFEPLNQTLDPEVQSLHAVWEADGGQVWAVGGRVISADLDEGAAFRTGSDVPLWEPKGPDVEPMARCPEEQIDPAPHGSIARRWNEQLLGAVRRDLPRPTVHARNLYHVSVAQWDAYAAYDATLKGVIVDEAINDADEEQRQAAISYASYRVLSHRYKNAIGGAVSQACFDAFMDKLDYSVDKTITKGNSGVAWGNRVAQAIIENFAEDGANEANGYKDPDGFRPENPPLVVDEPGIVVDEPLQFQQLLLSEAVTQNGISEGSGVRDYVGAHWGAVTPFAMVRTEKDEPYFAGDNPPLSLNDDLRGAIADVLKRSSELDIADGEIWDISPGAYGNNTLGTNDGEGYALNPVTGKPYRAQPVLRGDFTRVLAEFWADGPQSETPPGHWNTLANHVADHPETEKRLFGEGDELSDLAWDVHVYLALNGAVHDAAIAAWELKRHYTSARPVTLIRYLCSLGQRTDPKELSYHEDGIDLVPGMVEVITEASSKPGERHAHLKRYLGEIAVRSWRGEPGDRDSEVGHVDWVRAAEWIPYQRRTFVTPAFPGYVSGHSTFSRAGAEVLTALTGTEFFPGGLGRYVIDPGYLVFEHGPVDQFELQWATYYDAADQAGQSRLWGGIHVRNDDFDGRKIGKQVGLLAVERAKSFFAAP